MDIPKLNSLEETISWLKDYTGNKNDLFQHCIDKKHSSFSEVITIIVSFFLGLMSIVPEIQNNIPITISWLIVLVLICIYSIVQNKKNKKYDYILIALAKEKM